MGYIGPIPAQVPLTSSDIEDGIITADKLATDAVETAKVKDVNVTAGKLATTQDLSSKTITLPATVAGLGTGINVTNQITGVVPAANLGSGTASSSTYLAGDSTYKTISEYDDNKLQSNIALLGFKTAVNGSLAKYNLQDQIIDEYEDATGIDAGASTNEILSSGVYAGGSAGTGPTGGASTGTYTHDGVTYSFNKFTADTNLVTSDAGTVDIFLIGGGGGTVGDNAGGGGAGGLIWKPGHTLAASTTFAVDIGAGGTGTTATNQDSTTSGEDTTFASTTFVAKGGGYGGSEAIVGSDGGSGGGGGRNTGSTPGDETQSGVGGDSSTYGFGYDGGTGWDSGNCGAGGGGSGAVGLNGVSGTVGNGGVGKSDFVNSSATETTAFLLALTAGTDSSNVATDASSTGTLYIGAGGSGGTQARGTHSGGGVGGIGGGANIGDASNGNDGMTNTGSGGSGTTSGSGTGGDGGSGLVIVRYIATNFTQTADLTLQSTDTTAMAEPDYADMVMLMENAEGTATINTDIKGYISKDSGSTFTEGTLVDEGTWGTNKKIYAFHDLDISAQSGTSMCYKITTHNQSAGSKETKIHATSIGWKA